MPRNILSKKLTKQSLKKILKSRFENDKTFKLSDLQNPFELKDLKKAAKRVVKAIDNKEKITVVGDYDVDGIISLAIIKNFFDYIKYDIEIIIPNRFSDGYGLSKDIIEKIKSSLVITVDNGIGAFEAAKRAKEKNIDLIITDHHEPKEELPNAYAIVNPKQKDCSSSFKEICGATVAWYFIAGLKNLLKVKYNLKNELDLVAIATVADAMPLVDINRVLVKAGLKLLNNSTKIALQVLKEQMQKQTFTSEDISYLIAPRLNAAGRLESAMSAFKFIVSKNIQDAKRHLEYLTMLNDKRKSIEKDIFQKAGQEVDENDKIIVVWGEEWHEGVIGIVASKLNDACKKPAIVFSIKDDMAKGSARSMGGVDIFSLILESKELLEGFGGHKMAAGLSIKKENLIKFKEMINKKAELINQELFRPKLNIVGEMEFDEFDNECYEIIKSFEPYGEANPKPLFLAKNCKVVLSQRVGANNNHLKLLLELNTHHKKAMAFFNDKEIKRGEEIDFVYTFVKNEFRNEINFEFRVIEFL